MPLQGAVARVSATRLVGAKQCEGTVWSPTRPRVRTGRGFDFRKRRSKYKSHPIKLDGLYILVEATGIEPETIFIKSIA